MKKTSFLAGRQVFISYSRDDYELAAQIGHALHEAGVAYYLDQKKIDWGTRVTKEVQKALSNCAALVVILSPASLKSKWVHLVLLKARYYWLTHKLSLLKVRSRYPHR